MPHLRVAIVRACVCALFLVSAVPISAADNSGPYNLTILEGGEGVSRNLPPDFPALAAGNAWSISAWINPRRTQPEFTPLLAMGESPERLRTLALEGGRLALRVGSTMVRSAMQVPAGSWTAVAATFDSGRARLFVNGEEIASQELHTDAAEPTIHVAPVYRDRSVAHYGGQLADMELHPRALSAVEVSALARTRPDFDVMVFNEIGGHWPWQVRQWRGLQEPQDAWTLPKGKARPDKAIAKPLPTVAELAPSGTNRWSVSRWQLAAAPDVAATGPEISQPNYSDGNWYAATVPGTVLTTLIDRGVYPDSDHGLNNMAIPERLARQDYWYRAQFQAPASIAGQRLTLTFKGINYAAEVWLNGARVGDIRGAFIRGVFDVTDVVSAGKANAIAVRVSPPPHPGIPHEESIAAGPGENGGWVAIDGPTFAASEGWDWIPGIRDRNTGLWQGVELRATGAVRLLDPQVVTLLPLPRTDSADVSIVAPVISTLDRPTDVTLTASFEGVSVHKSVKIAPGRNEIRLSPDEFAELHVQNPRLWWPNGYGDPALYHLKLSVDAAGTASDSAELNFGIRHVTYEYSLFDSSGRLRRVEVDVARGSALGERLIDNTHEKIKKSPMGWAASLTPAGEKSAAVHELSDPLEYPHLTLRVNGVRILARGGNWGMDDSRKRIQRQRLEPYFKLQKAANLNVIRNWMGTNTEDSFYELCDEYGMMVLNDFWASTQDFQVEPQDPQLFLQNAADTVQRYRNHPSIVLWFGRNEGVPQPILNEGLGDVIAKYDGTRHFMGSSNVVNLQGSGPYNYRPPVGYFTNLASGFSVETGTPSLSTLEAIQAMVPPEDRWPLSDTIAYHDWHFGGNGDVKTFMDTLATRYGEGQSLEDFERKAQMMNYETYRAVFEGLQAHMWTKNSGRLLWMSHPAWPSNHWQIYSHDYDTQASYYGVKKATEPLHPQMNLPDFTLSVVNVTREEHKGLRLISEVRSLDNRSLAKRTDSVDAAANAATHLPGMDLQPLLQELGVVIVRLELRDAGGRLLADNTYIQARDDAAQRQLNELKAQRVDLEGRSGRDGGEQLASIHLTNVGTSPALSIKLTLVDSEGDRVLPAIYSDNYIALLPGETRELQIRFPAAAPNDASVKIRGWNVLSRSVRLGGSR
jgi:hypothetical protein